jgi:hypothetical protein
MVDGFTTVTLAAGLLSKLTVAPATKLLPLRVTDAPPAVLPDCGLIELRVGAGLAEEEAPESGRALATIPHPIQLMKARTEHSCAARFRVRAWRAVFVAGSSEFRDVEASPALAEFIVAILIRK